ncbi:MAG: hypothetical protein AAGF93_00745 [Cyanobacteria bacterium P01_H01_bin.105]
MNNSQTSRKETLNYRLRPNSKGMRLDIWESSPTCIPGQASYRFFVTYQLGSADEAEIVLQQYLTINEIDHAAPSNNTAVPIHLRTLAGAAG